MRIENGNCIRETQLTENEIAKMAVLRLASDKRLAAMMPAWYKSHALKNRLPKPFVFVPNQPPVFPKNLFTSITAPVLAIPSDALTTAEYVKDFEKLNSLCPTV